MMWQNTGLSRKKKCELPPVPKTGNKTFPRRSFVLNVILGLVLGSIFYDIIKSTTTHERLWWVSASFIFCRLVHSKLESVEIY